ncbi:AbiJ-NTD4 domain-containing protein [Viridibacterium curvum]|uniref:HEPN AbiJ-N-terminal domain-containing protein n=1 Tax=Viridibacterium curvum TaxID=1101404 RepID=A0ABP9R596_9RHOO
MKTFSERKGLKPVRQTIQVDGMTDELRNSLWNTLHVAVWESSDFLHHRYGKLPEIDDFSAQLWFRYFKRPIDERPSFANRDRSERILKIIRDYFFTASWNEVYDFLEFVVATLKTRSRLPEFLNGVLAREMSAFRFIDGKLADITGEQERKMLEEALADTRFSSVTAHLERALALLSDRKSPDYRNSIKESISAVEAMARLVSENPKATLGEALKALEKTGKLHAALKDGFSKLYGYANDESGIRHAMLDEPNLTQDDAKYFLLSCTSFVNYLKSALAR